MFRNSDDVISWLLLRDGHAVPLTSLEPDAIKHSARKTLEHPDHEIAHVQRLNAVVDSLGFRGNFSDYKARHWPTLRAQLDGRGLHHQVDLTDPGTNDLLHNVGMRRALADRLFASGRPMPTRVFTGYGHDWKAWDAMFDTVHMDFRFDRWVPKPSEAANRRWIYAHRADLTAAHNFIGDQLVDAHGSAVMTEYPEVEPQTLESVAAFRWFIGQRSDGWVDIVPTAAKNLVVLAGPEGCYDLLWRDLRTGPPPAHVHDDRIDPLHPLDRPPVLVSGLERFPTWLYYHRDVWFERDQHLAEQRHYDSGGRAGIAYPGVTTLLERHFTTLGKYVATTAGLAQPPAGFTTVAIGPKRLFVSPLVTIRELDTMMSESGYRDRRRGDVWESGNRQDLDTAPAAATWYDALAYCAWLSGRLGTSVRLPRSEEYRAWRPLGSEAERRAENIVRVVTEMEPWSGVLGQPERTRFVGPLPWFHRSGLDFVGAGDFFEWTLEPRTLNGVFDQPAFPLDSWGAYKHSKVGFRLVIDTIEGGA